MIQKQTIYKYLFDELKECADNLEKGGDQYSKTYDFIYGGDITKWRKFANSLRLRLALRIKNADETQAATVAKEVLADETNTICKEDESATSHWGTTSLTWSPLYDRVVFNEQANPSYATCFM